MSYLLLIVEKPGDRQRRSSQEGEALYARMLEFAASLKARGVLLGTNSLRAAAVRLDSDGGRSRVIDGPFAEAKELIGGYFLLNCQTREQALGFAAECPAAAWASIEVRETGPCYE